MRKLHIIIAALFLATPFAAQAAPIAVDMTFDDPDWTGSFSYDDTTGQSWAFSSGLTAYALIDLEIELFGIAKWDATEWNGGLVPPFFGVIVDSIGRAALFGGAFDTATGFSWGNSIGSSIDMINYSDLSFMGQAIVYTAFPAAAAVPEPGSLALLGLGLIGMSLARRRQRC